MDFIPYSLPEIGSEEIDEVVLSLKSGWITSGPKVKEFERRFIEFLGEDDLYAVSVNSATAGLHLGLEALGISEGDEVITTSHTFTATAEVIRYLGADPVFIDIDPSTLCLDVHQLEDAITTKTKAIIPVHFAGLAADMEGVLAVAKKHSLSVMEDAAHALPTSFKGKLVGTLESDVTVFSFYANKTMTTGEGGMIVTRNKAIVDRVQTMRLHGINRDVFDRFTSSTPGWFYNVIAPGYKYNMTDIAASIGIHQLDKVEDFCIKRAQIAKRYFEELSNLPIILPPMPRENCSHSWHLFVIQLTDKSPFSRNEFIEQMFDYNIGCSVHYIPLHNQPYWRDKYGLTQSDFPNSQAVYEKSVSLPIYSMLSQSKLNYVIATIKKLLGGGV